MDKVGDCQRGENYLEEYYGLVSIEDTNVLLFNKTYKYKLKWLSSNNSVDYVNENIYYTDQIKGAEFKLSINDSLRVKAIEYGHDEGACGPQQDSIHFFFEPPFYSSNNQFSDSVLIGRWNSDWYKGDRVELLSFDGKLLVRRNINKDGTYNDHSLWKVDSSGVISYVDLSEDHLIYYRILENKELGVYSKYIKIKSLKEK